MGTTIKLDRDKTAKVILKTTDRNMRITAMGFGIEADGTTYMHEPVEISDDYFVYKSEPNKSDFSFIYVLALCYLVIVIIGLCSR